jgi:hypothetical protein
MEDIRVHKYLQSIHVFGKESKAERKQQPFVCKTQINENFLKIKNLVNILFFQEKKT